MATRQIFLPIVILSTLLLPGAAGADQGRPVALADRVKGADLAVVARVTHVRTALERNEFGDELIVSHVTLEVEETLKGKPAKLQTVAVEGGTLDGYTLRVSDMPDMKKGARGVFLTKRDPRGVNRPHLRGQGILMLDPSNRVEGSALTLDEIRATARTAR
jgi:hypothetical protein